MTPSPPRESRSSWSNFKFGTTSTCWVRNAETGARLARTWPGCRPAEGAARTPAKADRLQGLRRSIRLVDDQDQGFGALRTPPGGLPQSASRRTIRAGRMLDGCYMRSGGRSRGRKLFRRECLLLQEMFDRVLSRVSRPWAVSVVSKMRTGRARARGASGSREARKDSDRRAVRISTSDGPTAGIVRGVDRIDWRAADCG